MKTIEVKIYNYDELNPKAQERARDWFREVTTGDNHWARFVLDSAKDFLGMMGFSNITIYYSGFSSQGDGACFVGTWQPSETKKAKAFKDFSEENEILPIAVEFERLATAYPLATASITHRDHYCHERSVDYDFDSGKEYLEEGKEFDEKAWNSFCEDFRDNCREVMRWIYKNLEDNYEDSVSNKAVAEDIRANEYEFTEDGKRFVV